MIAAGAGVGIQLNDYALAFEFSDRARDAPSNVIQTDPAVIGDAEADLVSKLSEFKKAGDMVSAGAVVEALAALKDTPLSQVEAGDRQDGPQAVFAGPGISAYRQRWLDDDVLVAGTLKDEINPSIASDKSGNLYVAVEDNDSGSSYIDIYKSSDNGISWTHWQSFLWGPEMSRPSITVAEGNQNWLFMAANHDDKDIVVFRVDLTDPSTWDFVVVENNTVGVSNPRIASDSAEFPGWYVYLIWNTRAVDNWILRFSKSTDFGTTWQTPFSIGGYCGYPDEFYNAAYAYPDIDFGSQTLYAAFDNYTSACTSTNRDVFALYSTDYGTSWSSAVPLTADIDDENDPAVAAVKNHNANPTAVVAYSRNYDKLDHDVWYAYTQDRGVTWDANNCLSCVVGVDEFLPDLATSADQGLIHGAYLHLTNPEFDLNYVNSKYTSPDSWSTPGTVNAMHAAYGAPALVANSSLASEHEAGIAWPDIRTYKDTKTDIYFDGAATHCAAIEVEKQVWDPNTGGWVEGVTASLDDIVRFRCTIHNNGCSDLTHVVATDLLPATLQYAGGATVDNVFQEPEEVSSGEYAWDFADMVFAAGSTMVIEFDAKVVDCGVGENTQAVEALDVISGFPLGDGDVAAVKTIEEPDLVITRIICDRENHRIGYQVKNIGCGDVPAGHVTLLWIDGDPEAKDEVQNVIPPGGTYGSLFEDFVWEKCYQKDIEVCADSNDDVPEFEEGNNCRPGGCLWAELEWTWNSTTVESDYVQVMMAPVAADLNNDSIPDIIFSTFDAAAGWTAGGILRAISGADGSELFSVTDPDFRVNAGAEPAVADIDNDGRPEILVGKFTSEMICFEHDGSHKWTGTATVGRPAIAVADLDQDGTPEIISGRKVFNNDGTLRWAGTTGSSYASAVADLDLDGVPEMITGRRAYRHDGSLYWSTPCGGRPAIANFDADAFPEVAVVGTNQICLKDHDGALKWGPLIFPGLGHGPPVVADVDGDKEPEIGAGGYDNYVVWEADGSIKWMADIRDHSSWGAGSTAFDFDGDGIAEIVYSDERYHRIYRGIDGAVLFEAPGRSGTLVEQPVILDVDNDEHVELVFVVNNYPSHPSNTGIEVYGSDTCWPSARKIWNQHTYHVTNINDDATVPPVEGNNWETLNNYRTQVAPLCACDLNRDGHCNGLDWLLFYPDWNRTDCNDPGVDCECDLNGDGSCNGLDWLLFYPDWNRDDCPIMPKF
jgi:uncharacterized repeat protein (TIGR01451 family)